MSAPRRPRRNLSHVPRAPPASLLGEHERRLRAARCALTGRGHGRVWQAREQAGAVADAGLGERVGRQAQVRGHEHLFLARRVALDDPLQIAGYEKERGVLGADVPRGKGDGDALGEARNRVAVEDRNLRELLPQAARSGSLDKDALRQRAAAAAAAGGGGGRSGRGERLGSSRAMRSSANDTLDSANDTLEHEVRHGHAKSNDTAPATKARFLALERHL